MALAAGTAFEQCRDNSGRVYLPPAVAKQLKIHNIGTAVLLSHNSQIFSCLSFPAQESQLPTEIIYDPLISLPPPASTVPPSSPQSGDMPLKVLQSAYCRASQCVHVRVPESFAILRFRFADANVQLRLRLRERIVSVNADIVMADSLTMKVTRVEPHSPYALITTNTRFELEFTVTDISALTTEKTVTEKTESASVSVLSSLAETELGGMEEALRNLEELVVLPFEFPDYFARLGIDPPRGILLKGPPGVGKTTLIRAVATRTGAAFFPVAPADVFSAYAGDAEEHLRSVFEAASAASLQNPTKPSIVFVDELDVLCPPRNESPQEAKLVAQLLTLLDGATSGRGSVIVVAATNRPNSIDIALRRPGRLDRELEILPPDPAQRIAILKVLTSTLPLAPTVDLPSIAERSLGYVSADLVALTHEAHQVAFQRNHLSWEGLYIEAADFEQALADITPSAKRGIEIDVPRVSWDDIGGLEELKQTLREAVEWPLCHKAAFARMNVKPPRGVLLHGPPGCSKTTLVKAIATATRASFINLSPATVFSPFLGSAEATIREAFSKARAVQPCILFFDEIESIVTKRGGESGGSDEGVQKRVLSTLLNEMDGIDAIGDVLIIGATNRVDTIDSALLRPGRFDHVLYVPPPDVEGRRKIFAVHTRRTPLAADVDLSLLADQTEGFSGADIEALCREAASIALRENIDAVLVTMGHFRAAQQSMQPSLPSAPKVSPGAAFVFAPPSAPLSFDFKT